MAIKVRAASIEELAVVLMVSYTLKLTGRQVQVRGRYAYLAESREKNDIEGRRGPWMSPTRSIRSGTREARPPQVEC
jgi:hypothetical protein